MGGVCSWGVSAPGLLPGGSAPGGSAPGVSAPREVCYRGVSAPRGGVLHGGVCSWVVCSTGVSVPEGKCAWWRPPPRQILLAGGTHPTGMHSFFFFYFYVVKPVILILALLPMLCVSEEFESKNFSLLQQIYSDAVCRVGCGKAECGGGSNRIKVCTYAVGWDRDSPYKNVPACASCPNTCSNGLCGKYELIIS